MNRFIDSEDLSKAKYAFGAVILTLILMGSCTPAPRNYGDAPGVGGQGGGDDGLGGQGGDAASPCVEHECGEHSRCDLVDGAPTCICDEGYELEDDTCKDIDECEEAQERCDDNASCTNLPGSYECTCNSGFFGDGVLCRPMTQLVSVATDGTQGNAYSQGGIAVSEDGRYVAFSSDATNLIENDTNDTEDVFVRDMLQGTTERVSVSSSGAQANDRSAGPSISADGRYVVFSSLATNLVTDDTNDVWDVFVHDRVEKTTKRIVTSQGVEGNGPSLQGRLSANGRYVAFRSQASNFTPVGNQDGLPYQILLYDQDTELIETVSVTASGEAANGTHDHPSLSGDGRFVVYSTTSTTLVGDENLRSMVLSDRMDAPPAHRLLAPGDPANPNGTAISADGSIAAYFSYYGGVFAHDIAENKTVRVNVHTSGDVDDAGGILGLSVSSDGSKVAFGSRGKNLVDEELTNPEHNVFVRNLQARTTVLASVGPNGELPDNSSSSPVLSGDGRFVAFSSQATTFGYPGDIQQVYLRRLESE